MVKMISCRESGSFSVQSCKSSRDKHVGLINKRVVRTLSLPRPLRLLMGLGFTGVGSYGWRLFVSDGFVPPPPYDWWLYASAGGGALILLFLSFWGDGLNSVSSRLPNLSCLGLTLWFGGWSCLWFRVCAAVGFISGYSLGLGLDLFVFFLDDLLALSNITVNGTSSVHSPNLGTLWRFCSHKEKKMS